MKCDHTFGGRSLLGAAFLALGATLGCGASGDGDATGSASHESEALQDGNVGSGFINFKYWSALPTLAGTSGELSMTDGSAHLFIAMQRGNGGKYWGISGEGPQNGTWGQYDTQLFASPPAIAHVHDDSNGDRRIMVVGRGSGSTANDRRLFWSVGIVQLATPPAFKPPVKSLAFAPVSSDSFNDPYGYPALEATPNGDAYLVYINSDGRVYGHYKASGTNTWSAKSQSPALPSGWTPQGTPAITWGSNGGIATVVVRAKNSSNQYKLFRLYFTGSIFYDPLGPAVWKELVLPSGSAAVNSNPALEWDDELGLHTVYYQSGDKIYEASFADSTLIEKPQKIYDAGASPSFQGAPAVNGNVQYEHGKHWVIARDKSDASKLWFSESFPNSNMNP